MLTVTAYGETHEAQFTITDQGDGRGAEIHLVRLDGSRTDAVCKIRLGQTDEPTILLAPNVNVAETELSTGEDGCLTVGTW